MHRHVHLQGKTVGLHVPALQVIDERLQQVLAVESQRHAQMQPSGNIIQHVQRGACLLPEPDLSACVVMYLSSCACMDTEAGARCISWACTEYGCTWLVHRAWTVCSGSQQCRCMRTSTFCWQQPTKAAAAALKQPMPRAALRSLCSSSLLLQISTFLLLMRPHLLTYLNLWCSITSLFSKKNSADVALAPQQRPLSPSTLGTHLTKQSSCGC
jgi:hypothetical protein